MTAKRTIGTRERMSTSVLWKVMNHAYEQFGPSAWGAQQVPSYITSHPRQAENCAHIIAAFIRDQWATLDKHAPLYVFDLGAGSGRFAYLFLKAFLPLVPKPLRICYVMTDIAEKNIAFWKQHPRFQSYILEGVLDFCHYDAAQVEPALYLENRQKTLLPGTWTNPAILIGNYFFDTISHDLFLSKEGQISEGLLTVTYPGKGEDPLDPAGIAEMEYQLDFTPIENLDTYYPDTRLNAILKSYRNENCYFTLPTGAFHVLDFFSQLTEERLFFIAADQGAGTLQQIGINPQKLLSFHRTFSIPVNYHAIKQWVENSGGAAFMEELPEFIFVTLAGCLHAPFAQLPETSWTFQERLSLFPSDYVFLSNGVNEVQAKAHASNFPFILSFLRLGNGDPIACNSLAATIRQEIAKFPELWPQLKQVLYDAWEHWYWVEPEEGAFAVNIGCLMYDMAFYPDALFFFRQAEQILGMTPLLEANLAKVAKYCKI